MCIYIYTYIHTSIHAYIHRWSMGFSKDLCVLIKSISAHINKRMCIYIYTYIHTYMHTYTDDLWGFPRIYVSSSSQYLHILTNVCVYIHTIHTYIHTHIHTYIHTDTLIHIHTYIHRWSRVFPRTDVSSSWQNTEQRGATGIWFRPNVAQVCILCVCMCVFVHIWVVFVCVCVYIYIYIGRFCIHARRRPGD